MFLQASVILLTGGCLTQCMLGYHPPRSRHPPGADTPPKANTPPEQTCPLKQTLPRSRHAQCPPLGADPPEQTHPSQSRHTPPQEQTPPAAEHAGRYGQRAGGTHPTGMQSCFSTLIVHLFLISIITYFLCN